MDLSIRLTAIKDMIDKTACLGDIGCDHGYVSMASVREGRATHVIACDINKGPLLKARDNIEAGGLSDRIETRLSDGLKAIEPEDGLESIVIAGMGGRLMVKILDDRLYIADGLKQLVLQPQSEIFLVRRWVRDHGFYIEKEKIVEDEGKYYFVLSVKKGKSRTYPEDLTEIYDYFSEYLIEKKDPVLIEYLKRGLGNNLKYLKGIEAGKQEKLLSDNRRIEYALSLMK